MYTIAYDRQGPHGFVPNLVTRTDIVPKTEEWWDLCVTAPYSYEFRFLRYLDLERVEYQEILVTDVTPAHGTVLYPVNLNFFDPTIDYLALVSDAALELARTGQLRIVFYYSEGDDVNQDIERRLTEMSEQHNTPRSSIKFVISNAVHNADPYCYFPDDELYYRYLHVREQDYVRQVNTQPRTKKFTCLNRMDKGFRKVFAASMWYHGLLDQGYFSYTGMRYQKEYQEEQQDPVLWWKNYWHEVPTLLDNFGMHMPFTADSLDDSSHNNHKLIDHKFHTDAYWNFVVETHFSKKNIFLTEKTFKPILNLQPFIMVGSPGSLKLLKDMGYQTFGEWINEDYDKIKNDEERMHICFETAYELAMLPHAAHVAMMKEMIPVLAHNQQVFLSSKRQKCIDLLERLTR